MAASTARVSAPGSGVGGNGSAGRTSAAGSGRPWTRRRGHDSGAIDGSTSRTLNARVERLGCGRVAGRQAEAGHERRKPLASAARFGQLEGSPGDVAGVCEPALCLEHGGQSVERRSGVGAAPGGRLDVGAPTEGGLVTRRATQRGSVRREGLVRPPEPGEHATEAHVRQGPIRRHARRLSIGRERGLEPAAQGGEVAAPERLLVALVQRPAHAGAAASQQLDEEALLDVQPVLRLLPDQAAWAVHHRRGDLLATVRRQAMHGDHVGPGGVEQCVVDLVAGEGVAAFLGLGLLAHRGPGVGVDDRGAPDRLVRVVAERQTSAGRPASSRGARDDPLIRGVAGRVGQAHVHPERRAEKGQRVIDVVAVADERERPARRGVRSAPGP